MDREEERREEIRDVISEESSRGTRRKRVDTAARKRSKERRKILAEILANGSEDELVRLLIAQGLVPGSDDFEEAIRIFRAERGSRHNL